jgi:hypothetical protein
MEGRAGALLRRAQGRHVVRCHVTSRSGRRPAG